MIDISDNRFAKFLCETIEERDTKIKELEGMYGSCRIIEMTLHEVPIKVVWKVSTRKNK